MEVFAKLGSEGNWPLEPHSLPTAVRGSPVGGPGHLPAQCLQVISYSCLLSAFPSSGPSSCHSSIWNSFLPFFTGGFCWFFKPPLEDTLLFQEALLAALRPPQAGWVGAFPVPFTLESLLISLIQHWISSPVSSPPAWGSKGGILLYSSLGPRAQLGVGTEWSPKIV